ncbi:hypothetical protein FE257_006745 [Aspergillus nanangensis]|uniref:Uncharacterized protein n=1 Tax=Aspergillus nanangensis TaxID=2582783 RepID=A0AAD4GUW3_ASPNN|nr:hypothetical protein FE257_006745 [Aspergillus nanangensis]
MNPTQTTKKTTSFRDYIPSPDDPRSIELANCDIYQRCANRCAEPFVADWQKKWTSLSSEPFKGITVDGNVVPGLFPLADKDNDNSDQVCGDGAPVEAMVAAARRLLALPLPTGVREALSKPLDAIEWPCWLNPEIYAYRHGVRLEQVAKEVCGAVHEILEASLSPAGYYKASGCMKVNRFLGEIVNGRKVLNDKSYNFTLFGTPSVREPWGWQSHGHHLVMNCFVVGSQMVVSPVFVGAERKSSTMARTKAQSCS